ncbi:MAG: thiamine diphosphokinase [Anaerolineae bacterium]
MPALDRVAVVVNGRFENEQRLLAVVDAANYVIAADGGANWLNAHGRDPQQIVGDMDSVDPALLRRLEDRGGKVSRYPAHKDETDAELALAAAAALQPREIVLLGALGGRIDHALGNLSLLAMCELGGIVVRIYDGLSMLWLVSDSSEISGAPGDIVSLIPWGGDACGIHTEGLAYPLRGDTLRLGPSRGISNVLLAEHGRVTLASGQLLVVQTPAANLEDEG